MAQKVDLGNIPKNAAKPVKPKSKAIKIQVSKWGGKQDAWTVKFDGRKAIRIRLTESGFMAVLRYSDDEAGKRSERYLCYLSKEEWRAARRMSPAAFSEMLASKVEGRIATGEGDADKLGVLVGMLRTIS